MGRSDSLRAVHVGMYADRGGAAQAMMRVHGAVSEVGLGRGWSSSVRVARPAIVPREGVNSARTPRAHKLGVSLERRATRMLSKKLGARTNSVVSVPPLLATGLGEELSRSKFDVVNLHWLGSETLSLREISQISKPLVWRMPDLWLAASVEHYPNLADIEAGYIGSSEFSRATGALLRFYWRRKVAGLNFPFFVVCPSSWTRKAAEASAALNNATFATIPNPLDTNFWSPETELVNRRQKTSGLNLLFGAHQALSDRRKGWAMLKKALELIASWRPELEIRLRIFGAMEPKFFIGPKISVTFLGAVDPDSLREEFRRTDIFIATPLKESFGQTVTEAQSCGAPVLGTAEGGLLDTVSINGTGVLVSPGDSGALARQIVDLAHSSDTLAKFSEAARRRACALWDYQVVGSSYLDLYDDAISSRRTLGTE